MTGHESDAARDQGSAAISWGASATEWRHFSEVLGLTEDLLPVVSNPGATIHPISTMKSLGKTPSRYLGGKVVGIPRWTEVRATKAQVMVWAGEPDYGICLQTRQVKAIDIDIADRVEAAKVRAFFEKSIGPMAWRVRANSGKCLGLVRLGAKFPKRILKTANGVIELLSTGQQCIVAGTHPSGARYEWITP